MRKWLCECASIQYSLTCIEACCFMSAPGNVMDQVIIERESESTIMFVEGARTAYFGYVTLKVIEIKALKHGIIF